MSWIHFAKADVNVMRDDSSPKLFVHLLNYLLTHFIDTTVCIITMYSVFSVNSDLEAISTRCHTVNVTEGNIFGITL